MKKLLVLLMLCLITVAVQAGSITVTNYSFEQPADGKHNMWDAGTNGKGTFTDVPGWSSDTPAADSGIENDFTAATDGSWTGFLMSGDPSAFNLTGHIIAAGEVFTLQVDAKDNWTSSGIDVFQMSLYYDNAGTRVTAASTTIDLTSTWTTCALTFAANDVAASIGKSIGIELKNVASATNGSWLGMDNVRLDVVPEPATLSLLGLGVLAMLRKRK